MPAVLWRLLAPGNCFSGSCQPATPESPMTESPSLYGPLQHCDFDEQYSRVLVTAGCRTKAELAEILAIKQSSIAAARRRGVIPADWLVKLVALRGVNPDWIKEGVGPRFLAPSDDPADANYPYESFPPVRAVDAEIVRRILRCFPLRDLVTELQRRHDRRNDSLSGY